MQTCLLDIRYNTTLSKSEMACMYWGEYIEHINKKAGALCEGICKVFTYKSLFVADTAHTIKISIMPRDNLISGDGYGHIDCTLEVDGEDIWTLKMWEALLDKDTKLVSLIQHEANELVATMNPKFVEQIYFPMGNMYCIYSNTSHQLYIPMSLVKQDKNIDIQNLKFDESVFDIVIG